MARRSKKINSLFEEQIPDDSTLERSVDNDEDENELKDKKLPVHDSDADVQEPEKSEIPAPDADPKDLEKKHIEELAKRLTASLGLFEEEEFSAEVIKPEDEELSEEDEDEYKLAEEEEFKLDESQDFSASALTDLDLHNLIVDDEDVLKEEDEKEKLDEEDDEEEKLEEEEDEEEKKKDLAEMRKTLKILTKGSTLTESTKKKIETLFEAAVRERVEKQRNKYKKLYTKKLHESNKKTLAKLVKKIDQYHGYVVDEWIKENKLAIKQGVRAQVAESFIKNLKKLFETHNISIPNNQANLLDKYAKKVNVLESQLNEQINKNMKERAALKKAYKQLVLKEACSNLSDNQAARLKKMAESVSFTSKSDFQEKIQIIVENFFKSGVKSSRKNFLDEKLLNAGGISTDTPKASKDKVMDLYSRIIADEVGK